MIGHFGYEIELRELTGGSLLVELRGEFDLHSLDELQRCLGTVVGFRRPVLVNLSQVTFADVATLRELAAYGQIYSHHLTLCSPSPRLVRAIANCGLSGWFEFGSDPVTLDTRKRELGFAS